MRGVALSVALLVAGAVAQNSTCAKGLYMVVARGTEEKQGTGITGIVAKGIADKIDNSKIEAVVYPATFTDPDYADSEKDGVEAMTGLITTYHESCPNGKIAVLGYSQGGHIASDVFCGDSDGEFSDATALPTDLVEDSVVAIVLFGDPTHVANTSYDLGTSIKDGIFNRSDTKQCEAYSSILRSYCDTGDVYCDSGNITAVHGSYVQKYGDEIVDFVVKQFEDKKDNSSSSSASGTATATETASSSATAATAATTTATESSAPSSSASSSSVPGNAASVLVPGVALSVVLSFMMTAYELLI